MQIEETAKDIVKHVSQLGSHLKKYEEYYTKLGISLGTVVNHYSTLAKSSRKSIRIFCASLAKRRA